MAQEVMVQGAVFSDVPSVRLPDSSNVYHSFVDPSVTTATASDVASGKVFIAADGTQTTGTASGGGGGGSDEDFIAVIEREETTVTLPSGVTSIASYAFYNYGGLNLTSLPSGVTSIGDYAFNGCRSLALTSLPSGITSIGARAFQECRALAISALPAALEGSIATYTFDWCISIPSMTIPNGVTSIGTYAFRSCTSMTTLDIGTGCTSIGANAFNTCSHLQTVILRPTSVVTLANVSAFKSTPLRGSNSLTGTVYVPSDLISSYQTATNWSTIYGEGYCTFVALEGSAYE